MDPMPPLRRAYGNLKDLSELQPAPQVPFEKIDPNVRYIWFIGRLIFWTIAFLVLGAFAFFVLFSRQELRLYLLLGSTALIIISLIHLAWPFIAYPFWGYSLRSTDILIRSGVIFKRVNAVPFSRIQHVDSDSGPIERAFGIANLVIHTAGSNMGSLGIPGLESTRAESLRDYLSEVGHTHANL